MAYSAETFLSIARTRGIEAARAYKARTSSLVTTRAGVSAPAKTTKTQAAKTISQTFSPPPAVPQVPRPAPTAQPVIAPPALSPGGREIRHQPAAPPSTTFDPRLLQAGRGTNRAPEPIAPPRLLSAGPAFDLAPSQIEPLASIFSARATAPPGQVSQPVSPFTGRSVSSTSTGIPQAGGGRGGDPRQFGISDQASIGRAPPFTEFEEEHDRALEQTSLSVLRGFAAGDNPMFITTETWGRIGRNFASQFAPGATPEEIAAAYGYVEIVPGVWVPGETTGDLIGGTGSAGRSIATRAPIFSGQPGRFSGTRGASLGLTNWRI